MKKNSAFSWAGIAFFKLQNVFVQYWLLKQEIPLNTLSHYDINVRYIHDDDKD